MDLSKLIYFTLLLIHLPIYDLCTKIMLKVDIRI